MTGCPYGFRTVGGIWERRRLVDAAAALAGYAACDPAAQVDCESYLSAFQFAEEFRRLLDETGSVAGYSGICWSPWLWFDIDRDDDLPKAATDARRLAVTLDERYRLADDALLAFFSGSKGFHLGLPTALWRPEPSDRFHRVARQFATALAERAGVAIDTGVYDRVRAFRAPNSRHAKTGLHKRHLPIDVLMGLSVAGILDLARQPEPFDLPTPTGTSDQAIADWAQAVQAVERQAAANAERRAATNGKPALNRATLAFIRDGADQGDRHRLLFSAAANLAEFGCSFDLAYALLSEMALDSGLPPKDVRRQIECGLAARAKPLRELQRPHAGDVQQGADGKAVGIGIADKEIGLQNEREFGMPNLMNLAAGHANLEGLERPALE